MRKLKAIRRMSPTKIKPLIDGDMLRYEVGYGVEFNEDAGKFIHNFDSAQQLLEHKIDVICAETEATEEPVIYLTQDRSYVERHNRLRRGRGSPLVYNPNFRDALAVSAKYKGNRPKDKPFHYHNLTEYMLSKYDCKIAEGLEADDLLSIDQNLGHPDYETIICSRDKDLRITPGRHYSWECGKAPSVGPIKVSIQGELQAPVKGKLFGTGLKFFYSQLITGDIVDNVKGIPGSGPVKAYNLLHDCEFEEELFDVTYDQYLIYCDSQVTGEDPDLHDGIVEAYARNYFKEQAALLWMIQELDTEGNPVHYKMIDER